MSLNIETLAIGDELLTGKISDTNSTFVAQELFSNGLVLKRQTVIADHIETIETQIEECSKRADFVIVFGGLGPTTDDLTVDCACRVTQDEAHIFEPARKRLEALYKGRNREITSDSLRQVRAPRNSNVFENNVGLAPGFHFTLNNCELYFLPGVPSEMRPMIKEYVIPTILKSANQSTKIASHFWRCMGIPEASLQTMISPIEKSLPKGFWLGFRTSYPENQLLLYAKQDTENFENLFEKYKTEIRECVQEYCYTEQFASLEETIVEQLKKQKKSIALAESCTGGLAVHRLTQIPGSSEVVWGGTTVYQLKAKRDLLNVQAKDDGVSQTASLELAKSILEKSGCDIAAAVTGFMGPDGGTKTDPVGTTFTAVVGKSGERESRTVLFRAERTRKQWGAATLLLNEIYRFISEKN